ncbi:hypothetical protein [Streptacidiphilus sp. EB129]|jgi:hypothetical protein|uniref:hypothetical protein n=1 Tax=Streptacidiphilus sp. EB129 TaxID=3156262 RepID=UPI0035180631
MARLDQVLQIVLPFVIVGALVLLLRWTWSPRRGHSLVPRTPRRGAPTEYGLLVPVAAPADDAEALRLTARLDAAGIRWTLVNTTQGLRLMVWPDSAPSARRLLRDSTAP